MPEIREPRKSDRPTRILLALLCMAPALSSCGSISALRENVTRFNQGVHSTTDTELAFYTSGRKLECDVNFYSQAVKWSGEQSNLTNLTTCAPAIFDDQRSAARKQLFDLLPLYADKLQAMVGPANDNVLGDQEKTFATNLNKAATAADAKASTIPPVAGTVEAALIAVTNFALDQVRFHDAKAAAQALDPHIVVLVDALKTENHDYGVALKTTLAQAQGDLVAALKTEQNWRADILLGFAKASKVSLDAQTVHSMVGFAEVAEARRILTEASPFGTDPRSDIHVRDDPALVSKLNDMLDQVKKANHAIATADHEKILAAVKDLAGRAKAAKADRDALSK